MVSWIGTFCYKNRIQLPEDVIETITIFSTIAGHSIELLWMCWFLLRRMYLAIYQRNWPPRANAIKMTINLVKRSYNLFFSSILFQKKKKKDKPNIDNPKLILCYSFFFFSWITILCVKQCVKSHRCRFFLSQFNRKIIFTVRLKKIYKLSGSANNCVLTKIFPLFILRNFL